MPRRPRADEHVDFYRTHFGNEVLEAEVRLLLERLPTRGRVLSVGCGVGVHEVEIEARRSGLDVICLDLQREMLIRVPVSLARVQGDMKELPFEDEAFDAIYLVTSLEFVPEPERALEELVRVLVPGGALVLLCLNPVSQWGQKRLRELEASWGDLESLERIVAEATGGPVDVAFALNLEDELRLRKAIGFEDASLLVLTAGKETHIS